MKYFFKHLTVIGMPMFRIGSVLFWLTWKFYFPRRGIVGYFDLKPCYLYRIGFLSFKTNC